MSAFLEILSLIALFILGVVVIVFVAYPLVRIIAKAAFRSYFETKQEYFDNNHNAKEKEKKNEI